MRKSPGRTITPRKQVVKQEAPTTINEEEMRQNLKEVKDLEEKIVQITAKNIAQARQNEQKSYENQRDSEFIRFRKSVISGQRDKIRRSREENQEQIDRSKDIQSNISAIHQENTKLEEKINEILQQQMPKEIDENATKSQRMEYLRKKVRAYEICNKIQRQLLKTGIPIKVKEMQITKDALQERVDFADERRKKANEIIAMNNQEKLIPQKITQIDSVNDIADDAELCSARSTINLESLDFETSQELDKARYMEAENKRRLDELAQREKDLNRRIERRQRKLEEASRREEEEKNENNNTEASLDASNIVEEEEEIPEDTSLTGKYINLTPEEKARRRKIKDQFVKACRDSAAGTTDHLQRQVLEMRLTYAKLKKDDSEYQVSFNERQLARAKKVQEKAKELLEQYQEDIQKQDDSVDGPRNAIQEQIDRNNKILAEARGELKARQEEIQSLEKELQEAKDSANEAIAKTSA